MRLKMTENQAPEATETKAPKQHPCFCSKLEVLVNVREEPEGGDLTWDEEHNTGCDPEVLTSKTFRPGHDAKAVSFLLEAHEKGWEVSVLDGGMRSTASPDIIAATLGDALFDKYNKAVANLTKKQAVRQQREADRASKKEAAEAAKAERKAAREAEKAAKAQAAADQNDEAGADQNGE